MSAFELDEQDVWTTFRSEQRVLRVWFVAPNVVRITFTEGRELLVRPSRIVTARPQETAYEIEVKEDTYVLRTASLLVVVAKANGALNYFTAAGVPLTREPKAGGKHLKRRSVMRNVFDRNAAVEVDGSIDGVRANARSYESVFDCEAFEARLEFVFADDEAIFGLGSHEEGFANLRGCSRELYQQNMKAVVPHLVSTRGYSVLFDCASLMTFHDDDGGASWWADCVDELDYCVIQGDSIDDVVGSYRSLTGRVPLPPKWAFGYVQSKERYVTAEEMLDVAREYRRRKVPLDVIVLDWKSWPNDGGWGQKAFDSLRFPEPAHWIEQLHEIGVKLMVSIWPIMTGGCDNQQELLAKGLMLGNESTYNAFSEQARDCYWQQAERGLFAHGVDAWWCDCTEPFEADWRGAIKPEPAERLLLNTAESKLYLDDGDINAYSLMHSQGIYENQRARDNTKRVLNLTRSSYAGQSRYGTFTWNGDICGTWDSLRRCIAEGLNFCATGEPYWTVDVGGFFLANNPELWFWRGDYDAGARGLTDMNAVGPDANDTGCTDLGFHELYARWMQYAAFLPMMRSHGTDAAREVWRFGEPGSLFYDAIVDAICLRSRMMPYVYSVAAAVTFAGASMMLPLALAYPEDRRTYDIADQYMFGPAMMICPVVEPMLYGVGSTGLGSVKQSREVYLPRGFRWYDFWSEQSYDGSQTIDAAAPLERIPVFVREGSVFALGQVMQFSDERIDAPYDVHVYSGRDGEFVLYEDDGTTYAYEQGHCVRTRFAWDEGRWTLTIKGRAGEYAGMTRERELRIVLHTPDDVRARSVRYCGALLFCSFAEPASEETTQP